jgi:hypothetical protein
MTVARPLGCAQTTALFARNASQRRKIVLVSWKEILTSSMDPHSIVVVSLHSPKEKIWGELLAVSTAGVTMRGIDLNSFDHFIRQLNEPDGERVGVPTLFFPMTRVERITLDEPTGSIPSMDELFARKIGRRLIDYLAQFA